MIRTTTFSKFRRIMYSNSQIEGRSRNVASVLRKILIVATKMPIKVPQKNTDEKISER